mmetsp:Transcript_8796/g.10274  ORF Transcript_8796/g.10274 Transcript_8796/m.10274 type:complete len:90 (-) Transcript_8796:127-396(-)
MMPVMMMIMMIMMIKVDEEGIFGIVRKVIVLELVVIAVDTMSDLDTGDPFIYFVLYTNRPFVMRFCNIPAYISSRLLNSANILMNGFAS